MCQEKVNQYAVNVEISACLLPRPCGRTAAHRGRQGHCFSLNIPGAKHLLPVPSTPALTQLSLCRPPCFKPQRSPNAKATAVQKGCRLFCVRRRPLPGLSILQLPAPWFSRREASASLLSLPGRCHPGQG